MRVKRYYDEGKELTLRPVIASYPTHRIPLFYIEEWEKYMCGGYECSVNGKRSDIFGIANFDTTIGVTNAELIWDPDEIEFGDAFDEMAKQRAIAWDWEEHCPIIVPDIKYGEWHVNGTVGEIDRTKSFKETYVSKPDRVFGERYDVSMSEVYEKFPDLIFIGYYHVDTTNADPHDFYQAVIWNSKFVIKIGELFEIDDGWHEYEPVLDKSGIVIKEMVMLPNKHELELQSENNELSEDNSNE